MNELIRASVVFNLIFLSTTTLAADEWSSAGQREEWRTSLEEESVGTLTSRVLFDPTGHLVGQKDLKATSHLPTSLPGALVEAMADYFGIVSEDLRLLSIDRNPQAPRTDFKIVAPSSGSTIDWRGGTCLPAIPSSQRAVLGHGFYEGWKSLVPGPPGVGRDGLFRAWRLTILNAFYLTTDSFPVGLDMVAALLAMTPPSQFVYSTYPYPNNAIAAALLASGCW